MKERKVIKSIITGAVSVLCAALYSGDVITSDEAKSFHLKAIDVYSSAQNNPKSIDEAISLWEKAWRVKGVDVKFECKVAWNLFCAYISRWERLNKSEDLSFAIGYYIKSIMAEDKFSEGDVILSRNNSAVEKLFRQVDSLASAGNKDAMEAAAWIYYHGVGRNKSLEKALGYAKKAADAGSGFAANMLGNMYAEGNGVKQSTDEAMRWYECAAKRGYASSFANISKMYWQKKDYAKVWKWSLMGIGQGSFESAYYLGFIYWRGLGADQSYNKAEEWFLKGINAGSSYAMTGLAAMYADKKWQKHSYNKSFTLYQKAAENGNVFAMRQTAGFYSDNKFSIERDDKKAFLWYKSAAEGGDVAAQSKMIYLYTTGRGCEKSYEHAVKWAQKAAEKSDPYAMLCLGYCYEIGRCVEKDVKKAAELYEAVLKTPESKWHSQARESLARVQKLIGTNTKAESHDDIAKAFVKAFIDGNVESLSRLMFDWELHKESVKRELQILGDKYKSKKIEVRIDRWGREDRRFAKEKAGETAEAYDTSLWENGERLTGGPDVVVKLVDGKLKASIVDLQRWER